MIHAVFQLKFPGYGLSALGETNQPDGSVFALFGVEIPQANQDRYLLFRGRSGIYVLIDDFVESDDKLIGGVKCSGSDLIYTTMNGEKVLQHAMSAK